MNTHFTFTCELCLQCLQCKQVVAVDQPVIENVLICHTVFGVIGFLRIFQQYARFKPWPVFLADPGEFQFLLAVHCESPLSALCD